MRKCFDRKNWKVGGCARELGHPGFCTKDPGAAQRADEKAREDDRMERERHPVTAFNDITKCKYCFALVLDDDLEQHTETHGAS